MDPILTASVGVLLGALLGVAVWLLKDVRSTVHKTAQTLTDFRLEATRSFVLRDDCAARHREMDAKLATLDRETARLAEGAARIAARAEEHR